MLPFPTLPRSATAAVALLVATAALVAPASAQGSSADVTLDPQTTGGTTVTVASATLPDGGFVTIHDASLTDGQVLGSVRGASGFLEAGTHQNVTVHLDTPLTEDATLIAMPHEDSDGDRAYTFVPGNGGVDGPYTAGGEAVVDDAEVTTSATVAVADQPTDGQHVIVDSVEMAEGGFVAIHDERLLDGRPIASVLGHSTFLAAGHHEDVRVALDQPVMDDDTLIAMPHEDSDDDEQYDFVETGGEEDPPYADQDGEAVVDDATVTPSGTAEVTFEDQSTGGTTVHVADTFLPEGGFVAIHDSTLQDGQVLESVRGVSACLEPGVHRDLTFGLDDPLGSEDTLIAMPHQDTNDNCEYDFVTSDGSDDGPYTEDGTAVTDSGEVAFSAAVHYSGPSSDGRTVTVDHVDTVSGGFVALHDASLLAGNVLGSVVGVSDKLDPGPQDKVEVPLDEPVHATQTLIPMPHRDTNGNDVYDFVTSDGSDDGPYTDGDGGAVVDPARTAVQATVTIADQDATDALTVERTVVHDGGFVAIHDASLLDGDVLESVIGVSDKLDPGSHEAVEVALDDVPSGDARLIAMPHKDTNANGAYDFVTSEGTDDGPYVAGGGAVVHAATVGFPADASADDSTDADPSSGDGAGAGEDVPGPGVGALVAAALGAALVAGRVRR
jgi:hypothetical protein